MPKVLVIENECVSKSTNNGRTLGNLLKGWPKDMIAQFCISMVDPDYDVCDNFYYVSDWDALNALTKGKTVDGNYQPPTQALSEPKSSPRKAPFTMVARNVIWNTNAWRNKSFYTWVEKFSPDIILFMNGDSYFMHRIATDLAIKYNLPMLIFNCEGFYFFDKNIRDKGIMPGLFQKIFISNYRRQFKKTIEYASHTVYLNEVLQRDYDNTFHRPSSVIYTSSEMEFKPKYDIAEKPKFSYLGTFYFDRYKSLIEIANALRNINPSYRIDVYGNLQGFDEAKLAFDNCDAINYCGMVPYSEVLNVIYTSDIVFQAEAFDEEKIYALKYGFSTKVADSICSGTNFFSYAPESVAFMHYLKENDCAWYATSKEMLESQLRRLLSDRTERVRILERAKIIAEKNHRAAKAREEFQRVICDVFESYKKS